MCWAGLVSYSHISYLLLRSATVWTVKYCNKQFLNYVLRVLLKSPKLRKDHCSHPNVTRLVSYLWHQTTKLRVLFPSIFSTIFFSLSIWKRKLTVLDWTNKKCFFLFQRLKMIKNRGKNWGKQNWLFDGLISWTRYRPGLTMFCWNKDRVVNQRKTKHSDKNRVIQNKNWDWECEDGLSHQIFYTWRHRLKDTTV